MEGTMVLRKCLTTVVLALASAGALGGQQLSKVERLGYPASTKLLIVHADDLGMAHSQDTASFAALEAGGASSASVIVPAPWTPEVAAWRRQHPEADVGVHTALTCEWQTIRWRGLLSPNEVPSLYDQQGYLPASVPQVAQHAKAADVEREVRAQVAQAKALGLDPTHMDMHMNGVAATPEIFAAYLRVARENHLPAEIHWEEMRPEPNAPDAGRRAAYAAAVWPGEVLVDRYDSAPGDLKPQDWAAWYTKFIEGLQPGTITVVYVHLGYDDAEMRAATLGHDGRGAAWRQRDVDFFMSPVLKQLLAANNVRLTTWRELSKLLPPRS
ncbi:MAG TPA: polysaccharide deacetylase family protein [Longimicrobiales bacterium]